jgi:hypothetical protein
MLAVAADLRAAEEGWRRDLPVGFGDREVAAPTVGLESDATPRILS